MAEIINTLTDELQDAILEKLTDNIYLADEVADIISEITHVKTRFVDEKYDEGIDDENCPDEYVMQASFECIGMDGIRFVDVFYGNNTREITYIAFN